MQNWPIRRGGHSILPGGADESSDRGTAFPAQRELILRVRLNALVKIRQGKEGRPAEPEEVSGRQPRQIAGPILRDERLFLDPPQSTCLVHHFQRDAEAFAEASASLWKPSDRIITVGTPAFSS